MFTSGPNRINLKKQVKLCLHVTFLAIITTVVKCDLFIVIRITDRKWVRHPFCVIHTITIGVIPNFNGGNNGHRLKRIHVQRPLNISNNT